MNPPDQPPPPKTPELRPAQVPWGSRKTPAAPPPPPAPDAAPVVAPPAPNLSAKQVPWAAFGKKKEAPPPEPLDENVTHMPWAIPTGETQPPMPPPAPVAKSLFAKLVPWGPRKPDKPGRPAPAAATTATWALPKTKAGESPSPTPDQTEMEFARELQGQREQANEPSAEQLVALLRRMTSREPEPRVEATPQLPYKARPISFEASRWDLVKIYAAAHRGRLILAGAGLVLALAAVYLMKLVSLNASVDREWLQVDHALRQRYATVPQYVECIQNFSDEERFTLTFTERGLAAWRTAKTDEEVATAAARMERILILLAKVMRRCEKAVPAPEPNQVEASALFAELEAQRQQSRAATAELIQRYNAAVEDFNDKILGVPGSWLAWASGLHPRRPLFSGNG